jgi:heme-degrading monooxygenase HmoA
MPAKILIKRTFQKDTTQEILAILNRFRMAAKSQSGYIKGETWIRPDNPQQTLVVVTWDSLPNWLKWKNSSKRQSFEAMLKIYQLGPAEYEEFEYP